MAIACYHNQSSVLLVDMEHMRTVRKDRHKEFALTHNMTRWVGVVNNCKGVWLIVVISHTAM